MHGEERSLVMNELREALILLFAALAFMWLLNLARVGVREGTWYSPDEGLMVAVAVRLLLLASFVGLCWKMIDPAALAWADMHLPHALRWSGAPLAFIGLLLLASALHVLGRNFSTSVVIREDQTLVTRGPYRWMRHPVYTAFVCIWLGFLLLTDNWFAGGTGLAAFAIIMAVRVPREERLLLERFGADYEAYRRKTGRFLPRFR